MIKKFNLNMWISTSEDGIHWEYRPNREDILKKINEIIDVVNSIDERKDEPIKYGKWIKNKDRSGWHCSCCGKDDLYAYPYTENNERELQDFYCPNCGADMRERGEDGKDS